MNQEVKYHLCEALFGHVTESIIVTGNDGIMLMVNPATTRLFGYSEEELQGKHVEMLIPERFAKSHVHHRQIYNHEPQPRAMGLGRDLFAVKKGGKEFPVEISLTPFNSGDVKYVIAFIIDISIRKKGEIEIVEKQRKLEELTTELKATNEKLESRVLARTKVLSEALIELEKSKGEVTDALEKEKELNELKTRFISMASHEFRTPLTAILSSASLIDEYTTTELHEKRKKHVNRIKSAVNNLNDILSDFLSISKIEEGKALADLNTFNIRELIEEICGEMKGILKPGQELNYLHQDNEIVYSDKKLIRNIIINLVSNAIKFSEENKLIKIETICEDRNAIIKVTDQGIGISGSDQEHLFERFFRGQNAINIQGTGLGLNIVANYVELLNGYIEVESELDKGTIFTITIPIKK